MKKYNQLFNRSSRVLMAAALMSSAVAVPYVVNAEESTTVTYTVAVENITYAFSGGKDINTPGAGDAYIKPAIQQVDLVFDNLGKAYADITFNKSAASYTEFKEANADGKNIAITNTDGDLRTIRVSLDENYAASIYLVNGAMAARSTTLHFDLGQEAFNFAYTTTFEPQSYFSAWLPNTDVIETATEKYAFVTLAGHSYGIETFYDKEATDTSRQPLEAVKSAGSYAEKNLVRTFKVKVDANNIASIYFAHGGVEGNIKVDVTKSSMTFEEALATGNETPISAQYTSTVAWHAFAITTTVKALSVKQTGTQYTGTVQVNTAGLEAFDVIQNNQVIGSYDPTSSLVTFNTTSLEGISFKTKSTSTSPTTGVASTSETLVNAVFNYAPKNALPEETVKAEAPSAEKTVVKDLNFAGITSYTPAAALNIADYLNPYFEQYKIVKDQTGKQFVRATITGKAYGFTAIQYFDAKNEKQDVTIVSSTGEKLEQVRVIEFPYVENATNTFNLFIGSDTYGSYTLTFNAKENAFNDIAKSYAKADIEALYSAGLVKGKNTAGDYAPTVKSTRAEFAAILARAFYSDSVASELPFKDVAANAWYKSELQKLYTSGIVKGDGKNFKGNSTISREDAVVMLYRILEDHGYKATASADQLKAYKDTNKVSNYAKTAIAELNALGIYVGDGTNLNPKGSLDRQAMAKLANQVIAKVTALKAAQK